MGDVTVALYWTGEPWMSMALYRAIPSAVANLAPLAFGVGATVAECRNDALRQVETEWVIHLDADDELTPGYLDAMLAAEGDADVRVPAVQYIQPDGEVGEPSLWRTNARMFHRHDGGPCVGACLLEGNWVPIGAMVRTELARSVGWREWACFEDWDFWLRCYLAGASFAAVPSAVYRAHVRNDSRNRLVDQPDRHSVRTMTHRQIAEANGIRSVR